VGDGRRVVLWTGAARDSLDEILAFIALDSPAVASKVAEVVLGAADSLSLFAERGRVVPETETGTIREIFVYRYRLMYQVSIGEVRILAVVHGAMDFEGWSRRQR
jgi:toxin ParE1/3/4